MSELERVIKLLAYFDEILQPYEAVATRNHPHVANCRDCREYLRERMVVLICSDLEILDAANKIKNG